LKRLFWLMAFFVILALPMTMRAWEGPSATTGTSGAPVLVVVTPHPADIRNEFRWAFSDWHQQHYGYPVELEYLNPGGTSDVRRQLDTVYRAVRSAHGGALPAEDQIDTGMQIVWGGGSLFFDRELKPLGILRPLDLSPAQLAEIFPQPVLAGSELYDQEWDSRGNILPPRWVGICLSSYGIVYNADLCAALGAPNPQSWSDLANPRFAGSVALADPTHSETAAQMYLIILQRAMADAERGFLDLPANRGKSGADLEKTAEYQSALDAGWKRGMSELTQIAANARYFTYDSPRVPTDVSLGDSAVGTAIDYYGRVAEETAGKDRVHFVSPKDATTCNADTIAILYGTHGKSLTLADHFIEFILSPEGQRLWVLKVGQPGGPLRHALHRPPVRRDIYSDRTGWADEVDYFTEPGLFSTRPQWATMMSALRPIWAAAWIDDGEDLRAAYRQILAIPDPVRRSKMIAELVDLPITRADVMRPPAQIALGVDPDLFRAKQRLDWARKFLDHYKHVAEEAGDE
jgi:iron(III) transport system substrate-binding protein